MTEDSSRKKGALWPIMAGALAGLAVLGLAACNGAASDDPDDTETASSSGDGELVRYESDPYPSTYEPFESEIVLIQGATVFDGIGGEFENHDVLMQDGRIAAMGEGLEAPEGAVIVDGRGRYVTPGVIDIHSHLGVYPSPSVGAHQDGNEITAPVTAEV